MLEILKFAALCLFFIAIAAYVIYFVSNLAGMSRCSEITITIFLSLFLGLYVVLLIHPALAVLCLYPIGGLYHFFGPTEWNRPRIWKNIFLGAVLILVAGYGVPFILLGTLKINHPARQSEGKTNLASIATAEISYFAERGTFSDDFRVIGWSPQGQTKYSYYLSEDIDPNKLFRANKMKRFKTTPWASEWIDNSSGEPYFFISHLPRPETDPDLLRQVASTYGIGVSADNFTAVAIGNIDDDSYLDVWIINRDKDPINLQNDVANGVGLPKSPKYLFIEFHDNGFAIYPNHIAILLLLINFVLWITFEVLVSELQQKHKTPADKA